MKETTKGIRLRFWGVRGSIATPGKDYIKYGGNTSCVEVLCGEKRLIFDAGTGIRLLGNHLLKIKADLTNIHLFFSHTHWDHIQGFPFFIPAYIPSAELNIYGGHSISSIENLLVKQTELEFFPVALNEMAGTMNFHHIPDMPNPIPLGDIKIYHTHLLHPALSLGFRIEYKGKKLVYVTDNEILDNDLDRAFTNESLLSFIEDADAVIADCQYTEEEYADKHGWGHSAIERVLDVALKGRIKRLYIFHHDPSHTDSDLDKIVEKAKKIVKGKIEIVGSREGFSQEI